MAGYFEYEPGLEAYEPVDPTPEHVADAAAQFRDWAAASATYGGGVTDPVLQASTHWLNAVGWGAWYERGYNQAYDLLAEILDPKVIETAIVLVNEPGSELTWIEGLRAAIALEAD